ncbi:MAG TPA: hypothetical protein VH054_10310 [Polyangiaceae bacterium]|nr:hypothetical protein [Polyangiaceae bacterium]
MNSFAFLSWLSFLVNMAMCGGFVLACALYAKRIGGFGPWLVAGVGAIDALLLLAYRAYSLIGRGTSSMFEYERSYMFLAFGDGFFTVLSALAALVGFALIMTPKPR